MADKRCRQCGAAIPASRGPRAVTCSDHCSAAYRREYSRAYQQRRRKEESGFAESEKQRKRDWRRRNLHYGTEYAQKWRERKRQQDPEWHEKNKRDKRELYARRMKDDPDYAERERERIRKAMREYRARKRAEAAKTPPADDGALDD